MRIGIDDTDSPRGMCTTYLGAVLIRRLSRAGIAVRQARLVRLNPNVPWKTRGNAAVCIEAAGSPREAFRLACSTVEEYADLAHEHTHPGVVVSDEELPSGFYQRAVQGFCTLPEALEIIGNAGALSKGYKKKMGLIGATAAVSSYFDDATYEILAYRDRSCWGTPRLVERESLFAADLHTYPHTWDTVDRENGVVVCVPHTPDPVLFGIRGERPGWVALAREEVISERPSLEQVWITNQGTDAHLIPGISPELQEGCSYLLAGTVASVPRTFKGGHVSVLMTWGNQSLTCMAYEPTKGFREVVRALLPGDRLRVAGSYKKGSINLEKLQVLSAPEGAVCMPPVCERCGKRMTSAGTMKGYKCRRCGGRGREPETVMIPRTITPGWYEVPPTARRHLARPLCRGVREDLLSLVPAP
ncbi:MAG: tRNA(Ile)(2)-agmatinylcytidine synthase [Methanolinea sp.]|jgi:tRNA(Ile2)-agmatinylcytidine synthase|nr:tRNA(Ile)(2)-agmatinylcytidine synthase [Methanolinea sp.]